jgi:hypothetical protein
VRRIDEERDRVAVLAVAVDDAVLEALMLADAVGGLVAGAATFSIANTALVTD